MKKILFCSIFFFVMSAGMAFAQQEDYQLWLQQLANEAVAEGISPQVVQQALSQAMLDDSVVELDQRQPESTISFQTYLNNTLRPERLSKGQNLLSEHHQSLKSVSARYGVPASVIVALWGVESGFGNNMGSYNVIDSLVTLAYEGRRASFFRKELLHALRIMDEENLDSSQMLGSWAGAMGQSQFMPSTYRHYAVDHDQDGRRDIWNNELDVFASIANYLAAEGWKSGVTWGREVKLTRPVSTDYVGLGTKRSLASWSKMGVRMANGKKLPMKDIKASLIQPDGREGRSFLVYDNFRALMRWNKSTYFATSVGLLSDRLEAR